MAFGADKIMAGEAIEFHEGGYIKSVKIVVLRVLYKICIERGFAQG